VGGGGTATVVVVVDVVVVDVVVVVVGGTVLVVVAEGSTVVVVVCGTDRLSMSWEKPNAAWRPAAAPTLGGIVLGCSAAGVAPDSGATGSPSSASSSLGENAANAAIASNAVTTQVANARSRVNLTPFNLRVLSKRPHDAPACVESYGG
jgi:hypothetical protein